MKRIWWKLIFLGAFLLAIFLILFFVVGFSNISNFIDKFKTAEKDSDGDGYTDSVEEHYGTNPYDSSDYPGSDSATPQSGDIIFSKSGTGTIVPGDDYLIFDINPGNIEIPDNCYLGVRIHTEWSMSDLSMNPGDCWDMNEQAYVSAIWDFYDSFALQWTTYDAPYYPVSQPITNDAEVCPVTWDELNYWELHFYPFMNEWDFPACSLTYTYQVEGYICECW